MEPPVVKDAVGHLYFSADPGDFLVWNVRQNDGWLDIYLCDTGDLAQLRITGFIESVNRGDIRHAAHISDMSPCPHCRGQLVLVNDGLVDGDRRPFLACSACAFCEELFEA